MVRRKTRTSGDPRWARDQSFDLAPGVRSPEILDTHVSNLNVMRLPLPYEAAFLAGRAFLAYKKRGGSKRSPLPDFYIGAHDELLGHTLLIRDSVRYRTYFPDQKLICPAP